MAPRTSSLGSIFAQVTRTSFGSWAYRRWMSTKPLASYQLDATSGIATISLGRGPLNTLTTSDLLSLSSMIDNASNDTNARLLVIKSALPGVFSMGLDPVHAVSLDTTGRTELFGALGRCYMSQMQCKIPTVALIDGGAFAGGAVLALACDLRYMSPAQGKVSFSESKVGLAIPPFIVSRLKSSILPGRALFDMAVMAKTLSAEEARAAGFTTVMEAANFEQEIQGLSGKISRLSREVLSTTLNVTRQEDAVACEKFIGSMAAGADSADADAFLKFMADHFIGEGLRAYMERREPVWKM